MVAVAKITVSPYRTVQEELACNASLPTSTDKVLPPHSMDQFLLPYYFSSFPSAAGQNHAKRGEDDLRATDQLRSILSSNQLLKLN